MLRNQKWLKVAEGLEVELFQAKDEGKEVDEDYYNMIKKIVENNEWDRDKEKLAIKIMDKIRSLPISKSFKYFEPSGINEIKKARPFKDLVKSTKKLNKKEQYNKTLGAWLGRCAGCLLGKPVEGWHSKKILDFLKDTKKYPLKFYLSSDVENDILRKYDIKNIDAECWYNNVKYMPEDDDLNYTVLNLKLLESHNKDFTPDDVAENWLTNLPILHLFTAERIAYKNIANSIYPPESAIYQNPYREWIGAQIRSDIYGYITPGDPELGAELAWRDASISHTKNGIYGAMFVAAMISEAAINNNIGEIILAGLRQIPEKSRLSENINEILKWKKEGLSWERTIKNVHNLFNEKIFHHWCHVIPNAMIVCASLLYGELDFEKSVCLAVQAAFDTDCNGATVGSVIGMILGADMLPSNWILPLNNRIKSCVQDFEFVKISDMARRTVLCQS